MSDESAFEQLMHSGTIIDGAGKLLILDGRYVGACYPTTDWLFHIFDNSRNRLEVFASQQEADNFIHQYWRPDGTIDPGFKPIKLQ